MADVEAVVPCRLRWRIFNPFVPWKRMVATFYNGSPALTRWQVTINPISFLKNNIWSFKFSLRNIKSGEPNDVTVADDVRVNISINGQPMEEKGPFGYTFSSTNRYTYEFQATVFAASPVRHGPHYLLIEVQLSFPNQNLVDQGNELPVFDGEDLEQLSEDMRRLYLETQYSNLWLESRPPRQIIGVHSCIMHARWSNFFEEHPVERIDNNRVEMNISPSVLHEILLYMYSGILDTNAPSWRNVFHVTELCQVIDWYKLHHLYQVLADGERQVRTTRKHLIINSTDFPLGGFDGYPLLDPPFSWTFNPGRAYELVFKIRFFWKARVPWFSYSLSLDSPLRIYAQVNLEFERRTAGRPSESNLLHGRDYTIGSGEPVDSGTCYFPRRSAPLFNDFMEGKQNRRLKEGIQHFIRCVLYLSNGTTVIEIKRKGNIGYQNDSERFNVLSDHMHELLLRAAHWNLRVRCPAEIPRATNIPNLIYFLHKSIFATRLPAWRAVTQNVPEGNDIPDLLMCDIKSEAFNPVHTYMYAGKMPPVPVRYLEEIKNFAERGGLNSLRDLVNQMRSVAQKIYKSSDNV